MGNKLAEANELRKALSLNIKKQRKMLGLTQEKLAEAANLSHQTINDIEGCRMWVSDKTIIKLADVFQIETYQLLLPNTLQKSVSSEQKEHNETLDQLECNIIRMIKKQFEEAAMKGKLGKR
ncbi:MAG: helix-turn-helix transcriptional regulator [Treponema sp.]|nr:helix-turn-helix transcriptional regulator [Treponema sp.]